MKNLLARFRRKPSQTEDVPAPPLESPRAKAAPIEPVRMPTAVARAVKPAWHAPGASFPQKQLRTPAQGERATATATELITLRLGDFLDRIPAGLLDAGTADRSSPMPFELAGLSERISRGETTIRLAEVFRRMPDIFRTDAVIEQDRVIQFPWIKVLTMIQEGKAGAADGGITRTGVEDLAQKLKARKLRQSSGTAGSAGDAGNPAKTVETPAVAPALAQRNRIAAPLGLARTVAGGPAAGVVAETAGAEELAQLRAERDAAVARVGEFDLEYESMIGRTGELTAERDAALARAAEVAAERDAAVAKARALAVEGERAVARTAEPAEDGRLAELNAERAAAAARAVKLVADCDAALAMAAELTAERDAATARLAVLAGERDAAAARTTELTAERDAALARAAELTAEREAAIGRAAKLVADDEAALALAAELTAERDTAKGQAAALIAERDAAAARSTELTAERDAALARAAELTAEREAAINRAATLVADHDAALALAAETTAERNAAHARMAALNGELDAAVAHTTRLTAERDAAAARVTELLKLAETAPQAASGSPAAADAGGVADGYRNTIEALMRDRAALRLENQQLSARLAERGAARGADVEEKTTHAAITSEPLPDVYSALFPQRLWMPRAAAALVLGLLGLGVASRMGLGPTPSAGVASPALASPRPISAPTPAALGESELTGESLAAEEADGESSEIAGQLSGNPDQIVAKPVTSRRAR